MAKEMTDTSSNNHFQSSFARSIAYQSAANRSSTKSFDSGGGGESKENNSTLTFNDCNMAGCGPVFANVSKSANISPVKSYAADGYAKISAANSRSHYKQVMREKQQNSKDNEPREEEITKLKAECQNLTEENKKLQRLSIQSTNASSLQSQLDSLQWQLRQTESSKQMYRAVMEQVSKFLERVHKDLDVISSRMSSSPKTKTSRFPRSRSVHTMAGTYASTNGNSSSRCSSPSPTHYSTISNSSQITTNSCTADQLHELDASLQNSLNNSFGEYTWKPSRPVPEHITLDKLSQESFRFHRLVQSLLTATEPDLIHRLTPALSEVTLPDSNDKLDVASVGSCASLYQGKSLDTSSSCSAQFPSTDDLDQNLATKTSCDAVSPKPGTASLEDESGFSSMSSFHDVNLGYPKIGLPIVSCGDSKSRRWNSTPVNKMYETNMTVSFCDSDILRVLWV